MTRSASSRLMSSNGLSLPARFMNSVLTSSSVRSREPLGWSCTFMRSPRDVFWRGLVLEDVDLWRLAFKAQLGPARDDLVVHLLVELGARRERLDVFVVHAGVDQRLRAPRSDFRRVEARIEERAPGLPQNVDRL